MILHQTPGLLDFKSLTIMGLSAKPNSSNPIGMFGTGLKYSIATLMRMGAEITLWIGEDKYEFATVQSDFRGSTFQTLRVRQQRKGLLKARWIELPFTTEYGKFWKPWMVYRELHSNTLDEGGTTSILDDNDLDTYLFQGQPNTTSFYIKQPEYEEACRNQDEIFLPDGLKLSNDDIQILSGPSNVIYYRSLKVMELPKPSMFTYNILSPLELTEDRTIKYSFQALRAIATWCLGAEGDLDSPKYDIIKLIITADENVWEHDITWPTWISPGTIFKRIIAEKCKVSNPYYRSYVSAYIPPPPRPKLSVGTKFNLEDVHPQPWAFDVNQTYVTDESGNRILERPDGYDPKEWQILIEYLVTKPEGLFKPIQLIVPNDLE